MATQRRRTSERRRSPISHCTKPPCPWPTRPEDRRTAPGAAAAGGIGVRPRRNGSLPYTQRPGIGSEREFDEPNARPDLPLTAAAPSAGCSLDMLAIPIAPEGRPAVWNAGGWGRGCVDSARQMRRAAARFVCRTCAERVPPPWGAPPVYGSGTGRLGGHPAVVGLLSAWRVRVDGRTDHGRGDGAGS